MMQMKNAFLLFVLAFLSIVACNTDKKGAITGTVLQSDEIIISEILPSELKALDTVIVKDGKFSYNRQFLAPTFLLLELKKIQSFSQKHFRPL